MPPITWARMSRPIDDLGHAVAARRPLVLASYNPKRGLPDAAQCVNALIVVNDPADADPRPRLALSNGQSWDFYRRDGDAPPLAAAPARLDLMPLIREAVATLDWRPRLAVDQRPALPAPPDGGERYQDDLRTLAQALAEMAGHVTALQDECADLRARLEFVERHALARVAAA